MQGDQTLFARADWVDKAWQIVDPIVERILGRPHAQEANGDMDLVVRVYNWGIGAGRVMGRVKAT